MEHKEKLSKDNTNNDDNLLNSVLSSLIQNMTSIKKNDNNNQSDNESDNETESSEYLDLDLYLLDEEGSNVCDHIRTLNENLLNINTSIKEFTNLYKTIHLN